MLWLYFFLCFSNYRNNRVNIHTMSSVKISNLQISYLAEALKLLTSSKIVVSLQSFSTNSRVESHCREAMFSTINRQPQVRKSTCTRRGKPVERVAFVYATVKRCSMSWWCSYSASRFSGAKYRWRHRVLFARILAAVHNFAVFVQDCVFPLNGSDTPLVRNISKLLGGFSRAFYLVYLAKCSIAMLSINERRKVHTQFWI